MDADREPRSLPKDRHARVKTGHIVKHVVHECKGIGGGAVDEGTGGGAEAVTEDGMSEDGASFVKTTCHVLSWRPSLAYDFALDDAADGGLTAVHLGENTPEPLCRARLATTSTEGSEHAVVDIILILGVDVSLKIVFVDIFSLIVGE